MTLGLIAAETRTRIADAARPVSVTTKKTGKTKTTVR